MYKLDVQNIFKSYGQNEVLKGVSLQAKAGDVIAMIGSSGSGKSTFLRCINFLEQPNSGSVSLNGETLTVSKDARGACVSPTKSACRCFAPSWPWCSSTSIYGPT